MGLTLNSNSLTLESAGGGGGSGLTEAQVDARIAAKSEFEFINVTEIDTAVTTLLLTEGLDHNTYSAYKFIFTDMIPSGTGSYAFSLQNESGTNVNFTYWSQMGNTSYSQQSQTSSSIIYMSNNTSGLNSSARMQAEIEVHQNFQMNGYYKTGIAYPAGYWQQNSYGSFICTSQTHVFSGLQWNGGMTGGKIFMYGRRHRSAS